VFKTDVSPILPSEESTNYGLLEVTEGVPRYVVGDGEEDERVEVDAEA